MTEIQQLEQLMNEMLPGLQLFARDINLTPEEASKFRVGQIIRNAAFTDATSRVGGMVTTHRFSILSNHLFDLTKAEHGTNWGLHVANRDSHFKVLDIYEHEGKTQILLLHLPDDYRWKWMEHVNLDLPVDIVADSRERFASKAHAASSVCQRYSTVTRFEERESRGMGAFKRSQYLFKCSCNSSSDKRA